jgi:tellurite methyltransferase
MQTTIVGFHQDAEGHWVAELACGHGQHMRHLPPWQERPWVVDPEGRAAKLGASIDCPPCDAVRLPPDAREYRRTPTFTETTLPVGLRADHRTKPGTWARIVVEQGRLAYHVRGRVHVLGPGDAGVVEPEVPHHVAPMGEVRVHVEFLRRGEAPDLA